MSHIVSNVSEAEGNTKSSARLRRACFTLNNYSEDDVSHCLSYLTDHLYVIGREVGEQGTPHLQGYVEFKNQVRFSTLKNFLPKAHWEKARGNRDQNITYCSKGEQVTSNFPMKRKDFLLKTEYSEVQWRGWQRDVLDTIAEKPDRRTVNWFWEPTGNAGKSFLATYLVLKYDALVLSGKTADIANQIRTWLDNHSDESFPTVAILDAPRSTQDFINYQALEKVKDGLIYSGKYEGGICTLAPLHLFVFANQEPEYGKLSEDRWRVVRI